jgi:hyperosmotically inducible periplasmic protein
MNRSASRILWAGVGAAVAYFFDPDNGRSRRAELKQRSAAAGRDIAEETTKKARYEANKVKGMAHEMTSSEEPPATDGELLQKVRSEALGVVPGETAHIDLRVEHGVVHLVGHSKDPDTERELVKRIGKVTGVRDVSNDLTRA